MVMTCNGEVAVFTLFRPFHFHVVTLGKLFPHITKQYNLAVGEREMVSSD